MSHICCQNLVEVSRDRAKGRTQLTSARFCQQLCEIPSPVVTRHEQVFCSMSAHFRHILPAECEILSPWFNAVVTGVLLDGGSLPPDFARGFVQSRAPALARYVQVFGSVTASRLSPPDFASRLPICLCLSCLQPEINMLSIAYMPFAPRPAAHK